MFPSTAASVFAAVNAKDALIAFFALLSFGLLAAFCFLRGKLRDSIVKSARAEFSDELLSEFRRGMETRIGSGGVTVGLTPERGASASEKRLLAYVNIAEALSAGYECIYYIDLKTNHFDQYRSHGLYETLKVEKEGEDFFGVTQRLLPETMHPDDLERMRAAFQKDAMVEATQGGRVFSITYRLNIEGHDYLWYNFRAIRTVNDRDHLVGAIANVDEQVRHEKDPEKRDWFLVSRENRPADR